MRVTGAGLFAQGTGRAASSVPLVAAAVWYRHMLLQIDSDLILCSSVDLDLLQLLLYGITMLLQHC